MNPKAGDPKAGDPKAWDLKAGDPKAGSGGGLDRYEVEGLSTGVWDAPGGVWGASVVCGGVGGAGAPGDCGWVFAAGGGVGLEVGEFGVYEVDVYGGEWI